MAEGNVQASNFDLMKTFMERMVEKASQPVVEKAPPPVQQAVTKPDCMFCDRDGKKYPAITEKEYEKTWLHHVSDDHMENVTRTVRDLWVDFGDHYASIVGAMRREELVRSQVKATYWEPLPTSKK